MTDNVPVNPEREALQVLAERGWCKEQLWDKEGRVCILGTGLKLEGLVEQVIAEQFPDRLNATGVGRLPIAHFNDHPETTLDDVVLVLEKAAIRRSERVAP